MGGLYPSLTLDQACLWVMSKGYATGHADNVEDLLEHLVAQVQEQTAARCALVCEQAGIKGYGTIAAAMEMREHFGLSSIPNGNT